MKGMTLQQHKTGSLYLSGLCKIVIASDWIRLDEKTGFPTQESVNQAIIQLAYQLQQAKFHNSGPAHQQIVPIFSSVVVMQELKAPGKVMSKAQAATAANSIMHTWFEQATKDGYFDNVDPTQLSSNVDESELTTEE